jgi:CheY-like chemotaxis protein
MVVDDDSEMREMLSEMLFHHGFVPFSSDDPRAACEVARVLQPAAILCDIVMPVMSGIEAVERLQKDPETRTIPVILMTGHGYLRDRYEINCPWLFKPFTGDELNQTIARTVGGIGDGPRSGETHLEREAELVW